MEKRFITTWTGFMKKIMNTTIQRDWNWRYLQEHPVRFSFALMIALPLLWWLFFGGLAGIVSFIISLLTPENISAGKIISLLVTIGGICGIGGLVLTMSVWIRYAFRWNKIQTFSKHLSHTDERVRQNATFELGRLFDPLAVKPLLQALQDSDAGVRAQAALGLGDLGDTRAVTPLLQALQETDVMVRDAAVQALGYMSDDRVIDPLIHSLSDPDKSVRSTAATALGLLRHSCAVAPLLQALHDPDALVRWHVVWALEDLGDPCALPALFPMLHDPNISIREITRVAINHLQESASARPRTSAIITRAFSYAETTDKTEQHEQE